MAKKAKLDLSGAGIKKLAIEHCEKAIFGICAVLLLLLAYWGYSKPVFDDEKDNPNSIIAKADRSRSRIKSTKWVDENSEEMSFAKFRVADEEVPQKVAKVNSVLLDPTKYPSYPPGEISLSIKPKRTNPAILAATDVQAKFAYQFIALKPGVSGGSTRINTAMYAPEPEKKSPRRKRPSKNNQKGPPSSGGYGSGGYGGGKSGGSDDDSGKSRPDAGGASGSGGYGSGGMLGGGNSARRNRPEGPVHEPPEDMLAELEGVPLDGLLEAQQEGENVVHPSVMKRQVVCVTAQVPFKKQVEAYEKALKGTRRYDPATDIPKYVGLVVYRRINGGEWLDVTDEVQSAAQTAKTVHYPPLVTVDQYDPFINNSVPAFLMKDFDDFVIHSKSELRDFLNLDVPEKSSSKSNSKPKTGGGFGDFGSSGDAKSDDGEDESPEEEVLDDLLTSENASEFKQVRFFDLLANKAIKQGDKLEYKVSVILSNPNLPLSFLTGEETKTGGGMTGGAGGYGSGGGRPTLSSSGSGGMSGGLTAPGGGSGSSSGSGAMGSGGYGSGGSSAGGSGGGGSKTFDTSDELTIEMLGNPNVSDADLDGAIRPEILKFKDMKRPKPDDKGLARKYGMISAQSDASNAVVFGTDSDGFVSGGAPPLSIRRAENVEFLDSEPEGELVILKEDQSLQLFVPGKTKVAAGLPLVFEAKAEVFNPFDWSIRWIGPKAFDEEGKEDPAKRGKYQFKTKAIVLDVMPSRTLENQTDLKQEFLTPAEILVFDGNGFSLRNELDDVQAFRHATFAEDEVEAEEETGGFGTGGGGGAPPPLFGGGAPGGGAPN